MELTGRVALVTRASSGIGRATAVELTRRGAHVLVHGRDGGRTAEVAELVPGTQGPRKVGRCRKPDCGVVGAGL